MNVVNEWLSLKEKKGRAIDIITYLEKELESKKQEIKGIDAKLKPLYPKMKQLKEQFTGTQQLVFESCFILGYNSTVASEKIGYESSYVRRVKMEIKKMLEN